MTNSVRVAYIGPRKAGKTVMLSTILLAVGEGWHGYPMNMDITLRPGRNSTAGTGGYTDSMLIMPKDALLALQKRSQNDMPNATELSEFNEYLADLMYFDPEIAGDKLKVQIEIYDAAGEHVFNFEQNTESLANNAFGNINRQVEKAIDNCDALVVVVPFAWILRQEFLFPLQRVLEGITYKRRLRGTDRVQPFRVAIALTRYELLFTEFGCDARYWACRPELAQQSIKRRFANAHRYGPIHELDRSQGGILDIVFIPTSSFGFVPGLGSPNLFPADAEEIKAQVMALGSVEPGVRPKGVALSQRLSSKQFFPFLTADPFIFAATGLRNPFHVPIWDALGAEARTRTNPARAHRNVSRGETGTNGPSGWLSKGLSRLKRALSDFGDI